MTPAEKLSKKQPRQRAPRNGVSLRKTPWVCECRAIRESLRLTLDAVSEAIGISKTAYWQIEMGTDPMLTTATKIAAFYGKPIHELWKR